MSQKDLRMILTKRLSRGGATTFLINAIGMGLSMVMQIVLARLLGAIGYGIFAFVTTIMTFMLFATKLGFDTLIVRYVPVYQVNEKWDLIKGLIRRTNQFGLVLSILAGIVGLVFLGWNYQQIDAEQFTAYLAGFFSLPFLTLAILRQSTLQAFKDVLFAQLPEKIVRPIMTIILVTVIAAFGWKVSAGNVMICYGLSIFISYILGAIVLMKRVGPLTTGVTPCYETKNWFRLSISLMVNAGMYLILGQLNILVIGILHGETEAGVFSAAVRLGALVTFMLTAVNMTASPLISESYAKSDLKAMQHICMVTGRIGFVFAALIFALFLVCGRWLLGLFGPEFTVAYPALLLISLGQLFNAYCGLNGTVATMTGRERAQTKILIVAAAINVFLNLLLIPLFGITGGAIASAASVMFWNVATVILIRDELGLQTLVWVPSRSREG
jgi:O-antigen/teichoic acid export membrane protein